MPMGPEISWSAWHSSPEKKGVKAQFTGFSGGFGGSIYKDVDSDYSDRGIINFKGDWHNQNQPWKQKNRPLCLDSKRPSSHNPLWPRLCAMPSASSVWGAVSWPAGCTGGQEIGPLGALQHRHMVSEFQERYIAISPNLSKLNNTISHNNG